MKKLKILVIGLFISSCSTKKVDDTNKTNEKLTSPNEVTVSATQLKSMNLEMGQIVEAEIGDEIKVSGMADVPPDNVASVSVPINGFIKSITHNVLPGKFVAKVGLLATVQSMEFVQMQQDYLQAVNQGDFLEKELSRQKVLLSEDATAKKKLQQIESEYKTHQTLISGLSAKLKILGVDAENLTKTGVLTTLNVYSPIAGYIKSANVSIGKNINPTELLFEIVNKNDIHLELKVYDKDLYKIKEGQKVVMNDPRLGGEVFGKVFLIGKTFEGENRVVNIHVHLDNESAEAKILPGMYVNAKIYAGTKKANILPESAIFKQGNEYFVFYAKTHAGNETVFGKERIEIGNTVDGKTEVILSEKFDIKAQIVIKGGNVLQALLAKNEE